MTDETPGTMSPEVADNFKDDDPTLEHSWQGPDVDELLAVSPPWTGPAEPGAFPDYQSETRDDFQFPPTELMPDSVGDPEVASGFEDRPFNDTFTQHPGLWDDSGRPSRVYTFGDIQNMLTASVAATRPLIQGSGILYGVTAFSIATAVTPFWALTDSLDGIGPVLMVFANNTALSGFYSVGNHGIAFENGLTLTNITGAQLAVVPIIRRRHLVKHKPTGAA